MCYHFFCVLHSAVHFFQYPVSPLLTMKSSFLFGPYLILSAIFFQISFLHIHSDSTLYLFLSSIHFSLIMSLSTALQKRFVSDDPSKSVRDCRFKINSYVVLCEQLHDSPKVPGSAASSCTGVTDSADRQRHYHCVDFNRGSGFDVGIMSAVIVQKDTFLVPYRHESTSFQ